MSEARGGRLGRRLQRILLLLPYAIRHPGVTVDELARKFGVGKRELVEDLNLVFLCGLPGYGPGDLIDVTVEQNRVFVRMADYFATPLKLTPAEALALYAGGRALASLPGMDEADALRRALAKIGRALGAGEGDGPVRDGVEVTVEAGPSGHLAELQRALVDRRQVVIEYFSASRGHMTTRTVDPWGLVAALGRWYLVAWDHLSDDERMFRTDRIKVVTATDEPADVPPDFDPERYRGAFTGNGGGDLRVSFEISPEAGRWFGDYYPVQSLTPLEDGWHRVELLAGGTRWAATLLLRLGPHARRARPEEVVEEAKSLASAVAAKHRTEGSGATSRIR
jgi:proteasome accessory factor C